MCSPLSCEFIVLKDMARILSKEQEKTVMNAIKRLKLIPLVKFAFILKIAVKLAILSEAIEMFGELHMHETELRNGVIVYVAIKDHKLAVWGDEGIHKKVAKIFGTIYLQPCKNILVLMIMKPDSPRQF